MLTPQESKQQNRIIPLISQKFQIDSDKLTGFILEGLHSLKNTEFNELAEKFGNILNSIKWNGNIWEILSQNYPNAKKIEDETAYNENLQILLYYLQKELLDFVYQGIINAEKEKLEKKENKHTNEWSRINREISKKEITKSKKTYVSMEETKLQKIAEWKWRINKSVFILLKAIEHISLSSPQENILNNLQNNTKKEVEKVTKTPELAKAA